MPTACLLYSAIAIIAYSAAFIGRLLSCLQITDIVLGLGQEETIVLARAAWLQLTNGAHQLRVEAVDGNFATSVRVWNFFKQESVIEFQLVAPEETDERASKIRIRSPIISRPFLISWHSCGRDSISSSWNRS